MDIKILLKHIFVRHAVSGKLYWFLTEEPKRHTWVERCLYTYLCTFNIHYLVLYKHLMALYGHILAYVYNS